VKRLERQDTARRPSIPTALKASGQRALEGFKQGPFQSPRCNGHRSARIAFEGISHVINYDTPNFRGRLHPPHRPNGKSGRIGRSIHLRLRIGRGCLRKIEKFIGRRLKKERYADFDYNRQPEPRMISTPERVMTPRGNNGRSAAPPQFDPLEFHILP